jgi:serine/threonine protein kinase
MPEPPQPSDQTQDQPAAPEQVRGRFVAAWDEALLKSGSPPDLDSFLASLNETERLQLRPELEALEQDYRQRCEDRTQMLGGVAPAGPENGDGLFTLPDTPPPAEAGGTVDFRPDRTEPDRPKGIVDFQPGKTGGTVDFQPGLTGGTVDFAALPSDGSPGGTLDFQPSAAPDGSGGTADFTPGPGITADAGRTQGPRSRGTVPVQTIAGYEILGTLGRGAMGVVYKARQRGLKRLVALKMILSGEHADERDLARFKIEAESIAQLQHPNIVQVYEVGEENGRPFFSLEYVDGGSLQKLIHGEPQPPRQAAEMARQLAAGMACAHEQGVVHRDLKPANILLTREGTPKITDFGLAKRLEEESGQTHSGTILGTPSYMAPEQAEGKIHEVGPLSDIYGLGAILYELLTGRPPFKGSSVLDTLEQVRKREPVAPTQLQPKVPRDLETICLKCLQKDPRKRYASAADLAEDLLRFRNNEPIRARPVPFYERAWRWCRRNPKVALLSAGMVVFLIGWAISATVLKLEADENARIARVNEDLAREKKREADENARQARVNEKKALQNAEAAIRRVIGLGEYLQVQFRRREKDFGPKGRALRDELLDKLHNDLIGMARDIERTKVSSFTVASALQQLGDLLRHLGRGQEALTQFQKAYNITKAVAAERPKDEKAQANLAAMVNFLGDMARELNGDAAADVACHLKALAIHEQLLAHWQVGYFHSRTQLQIFEAQDQCRIGQLELELGHPHKAREYFQKCFALRLAWIKREPRNASAQSYMAEVCLGLGSATWRLGDAGAADKNCAEAARITEALLQTNPNNLGFQADLADIYETWGDAQLGLGRKDDAQKSYAKALKASQAALAKGTEDYAYRRTLLAQAHERLAAVATEPSEAADHYQAELPIRKELLDSDPSNLTVQAAYLLTLAHCGQVAEAAAGADQLGKQVPLLLQKARCYAACAVASMQPGQAKDYRDKALDALRGAAAAGFRDPAALRSDPNLVPVRREPAFSALLATLRPKAND